MPVPPARIAVSGGVGARLMARSLSKWQVLIVVVVSWLLHVRRRLGDQGEPSLYPCQAIDPLIARRHAVRELVELGLIEIKRNGNQAVRVTKLLLLE